MNKRKAVSVSSAPAKMIGLQSAAFAYPLSLFGFNGNFFLSVFDGDVHIL